MSFPLQSYDKKSTFANFHEEKLQFIAFLVVAPRLCSHKNEVFLGLVSTPSSPSFATFALHKYAKKHKNYAFFAKYLRI